MFIIYSNTLNLEQSTRLLNQNGSNNTKLPPFWETVSNNASYIGSYYVVQNKSGDTFTTLIFLVDISKYVCFCVSTANTQSIIFVLLCSTTWAILPAVLW